MRIINDFRLGYGKKISVVVMDDKQMIHYTTKSAENSHEEEKESVIGGIPQLPAMAIVLVLSVIS